MDQAMQASSVQSMPEGQIDTLLHEVADEHNLELDEELSANPGILQRILCVMHNDHAKELRTKCSAMWCETC